jgi:hypothetical protein
MEHLGEKGKKGQGLINASSGHEPALFLCPRQQEANRTPKFLPRLL